MPSFHISEILADTGLTQSHVDALGQSLAMMELEDRNQALMLLAAYGLKKIAELPHYQESSTHG